MRLRARVGLAMYWCRPNDPGGVVQCCRKDTVPNQLEHGCPCPECLKGRVYLQEGNASPLVRFVGGPPIHATVYELQRSRCNLCGKVYTAEPPPGVGPEKYDETASSMVACCKYGCSRGR
jgi:hypothetical protein